MREKLETGKKVLNTKMETTVGKFLASFVGAVVVAFFVGLVVFGWWLTPVEWIPPEPPAGMNGLEFQSKATYVYVLSEWYAYSEDEQKLARFLQPLNNADAVACAMAVQSTDIAERARLTNIAFEVNGYGCNQDETGW